MFKRAPKSEEAPNENFGGLQPPQAPLCLRPCVYMYNIYVMLTYARAHIRADLAIKQHDQLVTCHCANQPESAHSKGNTVKLQYNIDNILTHCAHTHAQFANTFT